MCLPLEVRSVSLQYSMCEHSSVSPAAALREARRRKILENSTNRLKLIEGVNVTLGKASTESFQESKSGPEVRETSTILKESSSSEINSKLNDIIASNSELKEISDFLLRDHSKTQECEDAEEEEGVDLEVDEGTPVEKRGNFYFEFLLQKRLHYVILALFVNILLFFNVGYLFYENVFCPFYTVKTIELISRRREKEDFQPVLFLFIASLPKSVQKYTKIFFTVSLALLSDLYSHIPFLQITFKALQQILQLSSELADEATE